MDAPRPLRQGRRASRAAFPRGRFDASTWERSGALIASRLAPAFALRHPVALV